MKITPVTDVAAASMRCDPVGHGRERDLGKTNMTVLANAKLILDDEIIHGNIEMREGVITAISQGKSVPAGAIDCEGDLLTAGLVELHTDNLERHLEPRPGVGWPQRAAILAHDAELASVGITTVFDALRVGSVVSNAKAGYGEYARAVSDQISALRAENALKISHFVHLRAEICSETLIDELARFSAKDGIGILSLMDHTPGQRQFRDIDKLRAYVRGKRGMSEADLQAHIEGQQALHARFGAAHEAGAVAAARRFGAVLASHDDTTAAQVAVSKGHGVSFAEFPTTFEAAAACRAAGIKVMMGAPNLIRGGSHSGNIAAQDLAQADLLDILSSDYVPASLLQGAFVLADLWDDPVRALARVNRLPAEASGLGDRGRLALGLRADVIRVHRSGRNCLLRGVWSAGQRVG